LSAILIDSASFSKNEACLKTLEVVTVTPPALADVRKSSWPFSYRIVQILAAWAVSRLGNDPRLNNVSVGRTI
jgi:hypothetical protein